MFDAVYKLLLLCGYQKTTHMFFRSNTIFIGTHDGCFVNFNKDLLLFDPNNNNILILCLFNK